MNTSVPAVRLEALTKVFQDVGRERVILENVSLGFASGEFVALLGPSGSGKSTLLNLVSGLDKPTSGEVFVAGTPIHRLSEQERTLFRRRHIGFVFQFFNLIPTLTVLENVTLPLQLAGRLQAEDERAALDLLARVGLADRRDTFPDKLSGGEQQRVAICRALAHSPTLVLADEPTGNLDQKSGRQVMDLLLDLTRSAGKTLLMATHSQRVARLADRVYRIQGRNLVENGVV
ncbi:MAG: ABC transporter ATP-binding protein [Anaerolineae bacterium]